MSNLVYCRLFYLVVDFFSFFPPKKDFNCMHFRAVLVSVILARFGLVILISKFPRLNNVWSLSLFDITATFNRSHSSTWIPATNSPDLIHLTQQCLIALPCSRECKSCLHQLANNGSKDNAATLCGLCSMEQYFLALPYGSMYRICVFAKNRLEFATSACRQWCELWCHGLVFGEGVLITVIELGCRFWILSFLCVYTGQLGNLLIGTANIVGAFDSDPKLFSVL